MKNQWNNPRFFSHNIFEASCMLRNNPCLLSPHHYHCFLLLLWRHKTLFDLRPNKWYKEIKQLTCLTETFNYSEKKKKNNSAIINCVCLFVCVCVTMYIKCVQKSLADQLQGVPKKTRPFQNYKIFLNKGEYQLKYFSN